MSRSDTPVNIWPVVVENVEKKEKVQQCGSHTPAISLFVSLHL